MAVWVVRAGKNGEQEKFALENDVVVVNWPELRDLKGLPDKVALESLYRETYPRKTNNMIMPHITQLWNLTNAITYNDIIILPLKKPKSRVIAFGRATGTYTYRASFPKAALHTIPVKWITKNITEEDFSEEVKKQLRRNSTVFEIDDSISINALERVILHYESKAFSSKDESFDFPDEVEKTVVAQLKITSARSRLYRCTNNARHASCITQHFENDNDLRTNRLTRCRNVLFQRST